jgi:hypothetical protein
MDFYTFFTCNKPPGCSNLSHTVTISAKKSLDDDYALWYTAVYDGSNKASNKWNPENYFIPATQQDYQLYVNINYRSFNF